jgi:hypothetical protein
MRVVMGTSIEMQVTFGAGSNVLVCIKEELADYRKSHSRFREGCFCVTVTASEMVGVEALPPILHDLWSAHPGLMPRQ